MIFKSVFKKKRRTPQEKNSVIYYLLCVFNWRPSLHRAIVIPQPTGPPTTGSVPVFRPEAFPKKFLTRNALDFVSNSQNRRFVENLAPGWANADLHKRKAYPFFFRNFWESVPFGQIRIRCHSSASVRPTRKTSEIKKTPPLCLEDPPIPNRFHRTFFRFLGRSGGSDKFHLSTAVFPPFFGHAAVFPADERITMQ